MFAMKSGSTGAGSTECLRGIPHNVFAYGFSYRKRAIVRRFLAGARVRFVKSAKSVPEQSAVLLWGANPPPEKLAANVRILRVEDGFLRSVGLGADLVQPVSWVIDQRGIYFDARTASDLEHLLASSQFTEELLFRASRLKSRIVKSGLTKYNVGAAGWTRPANHAKVILVPGQVETDASLRFGAPSICTNMGLLKAVRTANPDAYIVYKPHPDVIAGLRAKGQDEDDAGRWCNEVVTSGHMGEMLSLVDEVHVLTSLAGFEALLRGKPVTCYGQPFYAGWGLTTDIVRLRRRKRKLVLEELIAGALILYPTYVSRNTGRLTTPEQALDELLSWRERTPSVLQKIWRSALRFGLLKSGKIT
jgi:capsular polysaccharide export protein